MLKFCQNASNWMENGGLTLSSRKRKVSHELVIREPSQCQRAKKKCKYSKDEVHEMKYISVVGR